MRAAVVAALVLSGCAGRDTPADAWAFRGASQKPGDPSFFEQAAVEYEADPIGTAHGVGQLLGMIGVVVFKVVAP